MPYEAGSRLPGERASRLGHLDVIKSPLVKKFCESFEQVGGAPLPSKALWQQLPPPGKPLSLIFSVDGSLQVIEDQAPPHKSIAFVKTALFRVDRVSLAKIDKTMPHPLALRDLMADAAIYHATVFPLRNIAVSGMTLYDAIRNAIFESVAEDRLEREPLETLKWLAYEKWDSEQKSLPPFQCPHCESGEATLPFDAERGPCQSCGEELLLTDMLGFHLDMAQESAPDIIASTYMMIHETLLLFTGIRHFWENKRDLLGECLFLKDGPLAIRAQYSKLVAPIRRFLEKARQDGIDVCLLGQEKSGAFFDHLSLIGPPAPAESMFVPSHAYIREEVQSRPVAGAPYGKDTNYGAKVFLKLNERHQAILNIPTGDYVQDPTIANLIGVSRILATLPTLTSARYEGGLFPIELAHNIASLSTYPSAKVLAMFAEAHA